MNYWIFLLLSWLGHTLIHAVEVDIYQSMETGSDGDSLTGESMDSTSYGGGATSASWPV